MRGGFGHVTEIYFGDIRPLLTRSGESCKLRNMLITILKPDSPYHPDILGS